MRPLRLAYLAYFTVALPGSTLGLLWPSIRLGFHEPIAALGILLVFGVAASVVASAATGRILTWVRMGPLVALSTGLIALALTLEVLAPSLWVFAWGIVLFGIGFGTLDSALNVHAASNFGAAGHQLDACQLRPGRHDRPPGRHRDPERRAHVALGVRDHGGHPGGPHVLLPPGSPQLGEVRLSATGVPRRRRRASARRAPRSPAAGNSRPGSSSAPSPSAPSRPGSNRG